MRRGREGTSRPGENDAASFPSSTRFPLFACILERTCIGEHYPAFDVGSPSSGDLFPGIIREWPARPSIMVPIFGSQFHTGYSTAHLIPL
jgi:hypothetical protein